MSQNACELRPQRYIEDIWAFNLRTGQTAGTTTNSMPLLTIGDVSLHHRTSFKTTPDPHKPCVLLIHPVFSTSRVYALLNHSVDVVF